MRSSHDSLCSILSATLVLALAVSSLGGCGKGKQKPEAEGARPVKAFVVETAMSGGGRKFPGKVQASQRVDLAFRVPGPLVELPAVEGLKVESGALLARIDPRDFETQVTQAQSALDSANAELKAMKEGARAEDIKALEAQLAAANAMMTEAQATYARQAELFKKGVVSRATLDSATAARDTAKAQVDAAAQALEKGKAGAREEDIESAESRIRSLEAQLKNARAALEDTYLKAPFAGIVAKVLVDNFQEVQAKQPVLSLQDVSRIEIDVRIPEVIVAHLKKGAEEGKTRVVASFPAIPGQEFDVELKSFSTEADPNTQTYKVTLVMAQPEGVHILPGMAAEITGAVLDAGPGESHAVPSSAVFADEKGDRHVWVIDRASMTVNRVAVKTGRLAGASIEVSEGVKPGDMIAASGVHFLREGMKVRILGEQAEGDDE